MLEVTAHIVEGTYVFFFVQISHLQRCGIVHVLSSTHATDARILQLSNYT